MFLDRGRKLKVPETIHGSTRIEIHLICLKERSQSVYILVAANSPQLRVFVFQILGPYLKRFVFYGNFKMSLYLIVTNFVTLQ